MNIYTMIATVQTMLCIISIGLWWVNPKVSVITVVLANLMTIGWAWAWAVSMDAMIRWKRLVKDDHDKFVENVTGDHHL